MRERKGLPPEGKRERGGPADECCGKRHHRLASPGRFGLKRCSVGRKGQLRLFGPPGEKKGKGFFSCKKRKIAAKLGSRDKERDATPSSLSEDSRGEKRVRLIHGRRKGRRFYHNPTPSPHQIPSRRCAVRPNRREDIPLSSSLKEKKREGSDALLWIRRSLRGGKRNACLSSTSELRRKEKTPNLHLIRICRKKTRGGKQHITHKKEESLPAPLTANETKGERKKNAAHHLEHGEKKKRKEVSPEHVPVERGNDLLGWKRRGLL